MLGQIEADGLEIVRLRGAALSAIDRLAHVDSWRYDALYASEVVVEELEVAVRHHGAPLRLGRVVGRAAAARAGGGGRPARRRPAAGRRRRGGDRRAVAGGGAAPGRGGRERQAR